LELKRTLLGQPSPFPFGISSKKKTWAWFCTPGAIFLGQKTKIGGTIACQLQSMVKLLNFQIDHVAFQIVTLILWATVLHFCSTKTLLVNWMPWWPKFIACKLDAMMYVCLKSSDDSWSWHDLLDWLPFATSTLSTAWNMLLRGGGLCLIGVPWGFVSRCHQQDEFQMAQKLFPVHVAMTLLLLYYFRVQTSSFVWLYTSE
jgi:hypothetical protein